MLRKRLRAVGLIALALGMALSLGTSGLAQEATPSPSPTQVALPTAEATPTAQATPTPEATGTPAAPPTPTAAVGQTPETAETPTPEAEKTAPAPDIARVSAATQPILVEGAEAVELTVYNQDLGLVKEIRTLRLEKGENQVRYSGVASQIEATSVHFVSLTDPQGTVVTEQNYEYDIVSSRKLLGKYLDRAITLSTKEGSTYTGTLLSGADDVILSTPEGIKIVKLAQVQEFAFPELPEGLITKPSLMWVLDSEAGGEQHVRVTYLTNGINWRADYIAMLAPDDRSLSLAGWVTLDNRSGATYRQAKLKLVAGDIHRVSEAQYLAKEVALGGARPVAAPSVEERAFFEYHIYQVMRPVTVRDQQTKQIEFVAVPEVAAQKVFVYEASPVTYLRSGGAITDPNYGLEGDTKIQVRLEFRNQEESGLGLPLPRGTVRIYKEDVDGGAELVGEDAIDHTPKDEELSLYVGDAFDVVGERVQTRFRQLAERSIEETYQITVRNHKTEDIVVRVAEHLFRAQDAEIVSSSADYEMVDANTVEYSVEVGAGGEAGVEYTVRYRW